MAVAREAEIEQNYQFFQGRVGELIKDHAGEFAVLKNREIIKLCDTVAEAIAVGYSQDESGLFSIQEVTDEPLDLGFFSHANPTR